MAVELVEVAGTNRNRWPCVLAGGELAATKNWPQVDTTGIEFDDVAGQCVINGGLKIAAIRNHIAARRHRERTRIRRIMSEYDGAHRLTGIRWARRGRRRRLDSRTHRAAGGRIGIGAIGRLRAPATADQEDTEYKWCQHETVHETSPANVRKRAKVPAFLSTNQAGGL